MRLSPSSGRQNTEVPRRFPNLSLCVLVLPILLVLLLQQSFVHHLHQFFLTVDEHRYVGFGTCC